jgi:phage baseplate assembly protein W
MSLAASVKRAQRDLVGGSTLAQSALLSWESRCECLDVAAAATWSADRAVPDLMLRVEL